MAIPVPMPSLSPTMTEGKITSWLKKVGDKVSSGEAIAEVETDKSNLEVEVYDDGYLLEIVVQTDQSAPVGSPIAWIGKQGEKVEKGGGTSDGAKPAPKADAPKAEPAKADATKADATKGDAPKADAPKADAPKAAPLSAARRDTSAGDGRLRVSPVARRIAREQGIELDAVSGSGPQGRIVKRDIEAALTQAPAAPAKSTPAAKSKGFIPVPVGTSRSEPEARPVSSMRKVISLRMAEVKPGVPHFYLTIDVEMDAAMKAREEAKALELKVSVNDLLLKAAAVALRRSPKMNVSLQGDQVLHYSTVDIGIAVAIEDGLITPVLRDADQKGLAAIGAESRDLAERARNRKLKPEEYTGGTLTVSNLGMFGIDNFIAVINPPHAAILAVGQVSDKVVVRDGQMVVRKLMSITLSGDHRVIDGAVGAEYLRELKSLLEHPMRLLF